MCKCSLDVLEREAVQLCVCNLWVNVPFLVFDLILYALVYGQFGIPQFVVAIVVT